MHILFKSFFQSYEGIQLHQFCQTVSTIKYKSAPIVAYLSSKGPAYNTHNLISSCNMVRPFSDSMHSERLVHRAALYKYWFMSSFVSTAIQTNKLKDPVIINS